MTGIRFGKFFLIQAPAGTSKKIEATLLRKAQTSYAGSPAQLRALSAKVPPFNLVPVTDDEFKAAKALGSANVFEDKSDGQKVKRVRVGSSEEVETFVATGPRDVETMQECLHKVLSEMEQKEGLKAEELIQNPFALWTLNEIAIAKMKATPGIKIEKLSPDASLENIKV
jgi:hypothetical protein